MKKTWKFLTAISLALLMVSCSGAAIPVDNAETADAAETVETTSGDEAETTHEYIFDSLFDAKKAMFEAEELPLAINMYEEEDIEEFRALKQELNDVIASGRLTQEIAEEYYLKFTEAKEKDLRVKQGDIPRVYINTYGQGITWGYSSCDVVIVSGNTEKYKVTIEDGAMISVRGNSTASAPKTPFNLRFPEKISLLGMDKGRKWSFLANMFDKTLMRNYLSYYLAAKMELPYTSMCRYCDVYVDGRYMGNYTALEPVTDGKGRVEIDVTNYEYIFEIDMNRSGLAYYIKPMYGQRIGVSKPDIVTEDDKMVINSFFDLMEDAIASHDMSKYSQYIDVDSFVNFYIHSEITKSIDVYDFSTRYFLKDGKLYAGPVWDYDLSMGNVSNTCNEEKYFIYCNNRGYGTGTEDSADGIWMDNYWFHELLQDPEFKALVIERFEEVYPIIENLYTDNELGQNVIDWLLDKYGASFVRNYADDGAGWSFHTRFSGIEKNEILDDYFAEVEWLRDWLKRRTEYVAFYLMS